MTKARRDLDLTLEEAAVRLDVTRSTLSSWEAERTSPPIGDLERIAKLLSISPSHLLFGHRRAA